MVSLPPLSALPSTIPPALGHCLHSADVRHELDNTFSVCQRMTLIGNSYRLCTIDSIINSSSPAVKHTAVIYSPFHYVQHGELGALPEAVSFLAASFSMRLVRLSLLRVIEGIGRQAGMDP